MKSPDVTSPLCRSNLSLKVLQYSLIFSLIICNHQLRCNIHPARIQPMTSLATPPQLATKLISLGARARDDTYPFASVRALSIPRKWDRDSIYKDQRDDRLSHGAHRYASGAISLISRITSRDTSPRSLLLRLFYSLIFPPLRSPTHGAKGRDATRRDGTDVRYAGLQEQLLHP